MTRLEEAPVCPNCGGFIYDNAIICPACGVNVRLFDELYEIVFEREISEAQQKYINAWDSISAYTEAEIEVINKEYKTQIRRMLAVFIVILFLAILTVSATVRYQKLHQTKYLFYMVCTVFEMTSCTVGF